MHSATIILAFLFLVVFSRRFSFGGFIFPFFALRLVSLFCLMLRLVPLGGALEAGNSVSVEVSLHQTNFASEGVATVIEGEDLGSATDAQVVATDEHQQIFRLSFAHCAHFVLLHRTTDLIFECIINIGMTANSTEQENSLREYIG